MMDSKLYIKQVEGKGRGVFSNEDIAADEIIEFCPVIVLAAKDKPLIDQTALYDYYFEWGADQSLLALALGMGSLYNHDDHPNAVYETYFEEKIIVFRARRFIPAHTEITTSYRQNPEATGRLWFEEE